MHKKFFVSGLLFVVLAALPVYGGQTQNAVPNPLASSDQITAEQNAAAIVANPMVQQVKAQVAQQWRAMAGPVSAEQAALLQQAVEEMTFQLALAVQGVDPNYPKVISILAAPHRVLGVVVPGSRTGFDNPDTTYRYIPIDPAAHYVITGKRLPDAPVDVNYSLWDARNNTISNLAGKDLVVSPDGTFTITVDSSPADGTPNHIQTTPAAVQIFARETVNDWAKQTFDSLSISRLDPPTAPPLGMGYWVYRTAAALPVMMQIQTGMFLQRIAAVPVNTIPPITMGGSSGLLSTQAQEYSAWQIADDEALVVTVNPAGAAYVICPVYDKWFITTDYINHTQTLNNAQAELNPDGTYTFVISPTDPGVYNWVDTAGMHEGTLNIRWQGLPDAPVNGGPAATAQLVKLDQLDSVLPPGTKHVNAFQRRMQLAIRTASFERRYADEWVPPLHGLGRLVQPVQEELREEATF